MYTNIWSNQAKGLGFMNQAWKDSHVDNNYKVAIYSLHLYVIVTIKFCKLISTSKLSIYKYVQYLYSQKSQSFIITNRSIQTLYQILDLDLE